MATLVLSAAGAAAGAAAGGGALGLSSIAWGRAIGATIGRRIDQKIMGQGSQSTATGKIDRYRIAGAGEGKALGRVFGRMRVPGQLIWSTRFREEAVRTGGGGKGAGGSSASTSYRYSVSVALALCDGPATRIGRIWADGKQIEPSQLNLRFYPGDDTQQPDPKIEAVEGIGNAPAYRGTAYVVIEDLDLDAYGNRIPSFSFEVLRPAQGETPHPRDLIEAVCLIPGTGEYGLATTPVHYSDGLGGNRSANINSASGRPDLLESLDGLVEELPQNKAVSLVVSWFGNDLRCGHTSMRPMVEKTSEDGVGMAWTVSGLTRSGAQEVSKLEDRPVFGGTPADQSVVEAIAAMQDRGQQVMFYPFILMDIQADNGLGDPWSDDADQPVMPWRGRMSLDKAPGQAGSADGTAVADTNVAGFIGTASAADFTIAQGSVTYTGPAEWSYRRFILHYAALCAAAGGVEAFCIGSELRGLTQIRGANGFPFVDALIDIAAEARLLLGPDVKIGYAADWTEYFGYHPQDGSGDVYFHLDPLWADQNIDFIGIDNYMPLSDWRDGSDHADASWQAIWNPDYLRANIEGGEGYDWFYADFAARDIQDRSLITDGTYGEPWVYRYKDIRAWWENPHHERIAGTRVATASQWTPKSKPIWFTELGCAAIDKATNQPNVFLDPKSSESAVPYFSDGRRDDLIQMQYLSAHYDHWADSANNPVSDVYGGAMIDMSRAFIWAWDARPFPEFPNNTALWSDGVNYARGHWLNGRASNETLTRVLEELSSPIGSGQTDAGQAWGIVRGYSRDSVETARSAVEPLMLAYGLDAHEREGVLRYARRGGEASATFTPAELAYDAGAEAVLRKDRDAEAERSGRIRLTHVEAEAGFEAIVSEAMVPGAQNEAVAESELPLALTRAEGAAIAARWLAEAEIARDQVTFALPKSQIAIAPGDVVTLSDTDGPANYRVDRVTDEGHLSIEAVRQEQSVYLPARAVEEPSSQVTSFVPPVPVQPLFLDLPHLTGDEIPHAPRIAVAARPWPGTAAIYSALSDANYALNTVVSSPAAIGALAADLPGAYPARWDRGNELIVTLPGTTLSTRSEDEVLAGANACAIGGVAPDQWEIVQFAQADPIAPDTWSLRDLLRGQRGSEWAIADPWPSGSWFVLLDGTLPQIDLPSTARGAARHYRIGPGGRGYSDPSYIHEVHAFMGEALRPFAPTQLRFAPNAGGGGDASWIRRTRAAGGDDWGAADVPLGEAFEAYDVQVMSGGALLRSQQVTQPAWTYSSADWVSDGSPSTYDINVAQISDIYGPGKFAKVSVNV